KQVYFRLDFQKTPRQSKPRILFLHLGLKFRGEFMNVWDEIHRATWRRTRSQWLELPLKFKKQIIAIHRADLTSFNRLAAEASDFRQHISILIKQANIALYRARRSFHQSRMAPYRHTCRCEDAQACNPARQK